jgi:hypothetical protein
MEDSWAVEPELSLIGWNALEGWEMTSLKQMDDVSDEDLLILLPSPSS